MILENPSLKLGGENNVFYEIAEIDEAYCEVDSHLEPEIFLKDDATHSEEKTSHNEPEWIE